MSSTLSTVYVFASGSPTPQAANAQDTLDPPIVDFFRVLVRTYTLAAGVLGEPLSVFSAALAYLFAPVSVLSGIVLDACVRAPYALVRTAAHHLYPFYVFFGICLIFALSIGAGSRVSAELLKMLVRYFWPAPKRAAEPPAAPTPSCPSRLRGGR